MKYLLFICILIYSQLTYSGEKLMPLKDELVHRVAERIKDIKPRYPHLSDYTPEKALNGSVIEYRYQVTTMTDLTYRKLNSISLAIEFYHKEDRTRLIRPPATATFGSISAYLDLEGNDVDKIRDDMLTILTDEKKRFDTLYPDASNPVLEIEMTSLVARGNYDEVLALLKKGVTPNAHNQLGCSVLYIASEAGNLSMVELLIKWGADPAWIDLYSKKTAQQIANDNNHTDIVNLLGAIKGAFKLLNQQYGKDAVTGYFIQAKTSFPHLLPKNRMDTDHFQYVGIEGSDGSTFELVSTDPYARYARDKRYGYYYGKKIEGSDGLSFVDLGCNYAHDKYTVYYNGKKIDTADITTFIRPDSYHSFAKDKNAIYYTGKVFENADHSTFTVLNDTYAIDKNSVYCSGKSITSAHASSFQLLPDTYRRADSSPWAKDKNHVYYIGKIIDGADPETFTIVSQGCAKDRHAVYYRAKRIDEADVETFIVFNDGKLRKYEEHYYDAEDKNNKYFQTTAGLEIINAK